MNFLALATSGLRCTPVRTTLSLICIALAFTLFGVLAGVDQTFDDTIAGMDGASTRLVVTSRVSQIDQLPIGYLEKIAKVPGTRAIVPSARLLGYYQDPSKWIGGFAVDAAAEFEVYSEYRVPRSQLDAMRTHRSGAIAGRALAERYGWKVGDRIPLISQVWRRTDGADSWIFELVGIYETSEPDQARSFFLNYDYFDQSRAFLNGTVGSFVVGVEPGSDLRQISQMIDAQFANSADETLTQSGQEARRNRMRQLGDIKVIVGTIIGATLLLLFFLIGNEMRQSTEERVAQFAALRAIGFSGRYTIALVVFECLLLTVAGSILGLALASQMITLLPKALGEFTLPLRTVSAGLLLATAIALASAFLPAMRIKLLPVVDVLRR